MSTSIPATPVRHYDAPEMSPAERRANDTANFVAIRNAGDARTRTFKERTSDAIANREAENRAADAARIAETLIEQESVANRKATLRQVCRLLAESDHSLVLQSVERVHHPRRQ